jgi:hypothetical protein
VVATQAWYAGGVPNRTDNALRIVECQACHGRSYWVDEQMAWPRPVSGPPPNDDLTEDLRGLYVEAAEVGPISPRAAAALLRLLIDRLVAGLGEADGALFDRIGRLADQGIVPRRVIDAMDSVRVVGNEAVHEGQLHPEDNERVLSVLFVIVNAIVENTTTMERVTSELLGSKKRPETEVR